MSLGTAANTGLIVTGCVFLLPISSLLTCPQAQTVLFASTCIFFLSAAMDNHEETSGWHSSFWWGYCHVRYWIGSITLSLCQQPLKRPRRQPLICWSHIKTNSVTAAGLLTISTMGKREKFSGVYPCNSPNFSKVALCWWVAQIIGPLCPTGNPLSERVHNKPQSGTVQWKGPALFVMTFIVFVNQASHQTSYCWRGSRISV